MAVPPPGDRLVFKDAFACEPAHFFTLVCMLVNISE